MTYYSTLYLIFEKKILNIKIQKILKYKIQYKCQKKINNKINKQLPKKNLILIHKNSRKIKRLIKIKITKITIIHNVGEIIITTSIKISQNNNNNNLYNNKCI